MIASAEEIVAAYEPLDSEAKRRVLTEILRRSEPDTELSGEALAGLAEEMKTIEEGVRRWLGL